MTAVVLRLVINVKSVPSSLMLALRKLLRLTICGLFYLFIRLVIDFDSLFQVIET